MFLTSAEFAIKKFLQLGWKLTAHPSHALVFVQLIYTAADGTSVVLVNLAYSGNLE